MDEKQRAGQGGPGHAPGAQTLGTRQTGGSGCSGAWRHCSFPAITDKQIGLWLQGGPGHVSLLQMGDDFHLFAKLLGHRSPGVLRNVRR